MHPRSPLARQVLRRAAIRARLASPRTTTDPGTRAAPRVSLRGMIRIPFARSAGPRDARRMALVACPFCREMFEEGEETHCPVCGVQLTSFSNLPPSIEAHDEADVPLAPEQERLPSTYMGRGKGILGIVGIAGLGLFFLPWL